jgi:hypothetical protein
MASIHYLPTEAAMHTNEWPARRPYIPAGCDQQGRIEDGKRAPAPAECSTEIGADMPKSKREACSPAIGVLFGSTLGALLICLGAWAWRSLL